MLYQTQYLQCSKCGWTGAPSAAAQSSRAGSLCPVCFSGLDASNARQREVSQHDELAREFGIVFNKNYHTKEIASLLDVDVDSICRWIRTGRLKAIRSGRDYIVRGSWLVEYLAERKTW